MRIALQGKRMFPTAFAKEKKGKKEKRKKRDRKIYGIINALFTTQHTYGKKALLRSSLSLARIGVGSAPGGQGEIAVY